MDKLKSPSSTAFSKNVLCTASQLGWKLEVWEQPFWLDTYGWSIYEAKVRGKQKNNKNKYSGEGYSSVENARAAAEKKFKELVEGGVIWPSDIKPFEEIDLYPKQGLGVLDEGTKRIILMDRLYKRNKTRAKAVMLTAIESIYIKGGKSEKEVMDQLQKMCKRAEINCPSRYTVSRYIRMIMGDATRVD